MRTCVAILLNEQLHVGCPMSWEHGRVGVNAARKLGKNGTVVHRNEVDPKPYLPIIIQTLISKIPIAISLPLISNEIY